MEQQSDPLVPPKACPICSVAMQATETKERIVHWKRQNCRRCPPRQNCNCCAQRCRRLPDNDSALWEPGRVVFQLGTSAPSTRACLQL